MDLNVRKSSFPLAIILTAVAIFVSACERSTIGGNSDPTQPDIFQCESVSYLTAQSPTFIFTTADYLQWQISNLKVTEVGLPPMGPITATFNWGRCAISVNNGSLTGAVWN